MLSLTTIPSILDRCQKTIAIHNTAIKEFKRIQAQNQIGFKKEFIKVLNRVLVQPRREAHVERLVTFFARFVVAKNPDADLEDGASQATQEGYDKSFIGFVIQYLLNLSDVKEKTVRFRCCQLISGIMTLLKDVELDDEITEKIIEKMNIRLFDKSAQVRVEACKVLCPMIDSADRGDTSLQKLLQLMNDPTKEVRRAVLQHIKPSKNILSNIIVHTRDIDPEVRVASFDKIKDCVAMEKLTAEQRVKLIKDGLTDPDERVKQTITDVLNNWIESLNGDPLQLLNYLDVTKNEAVVESALRSIFSKRTIDLDRFKGENITPSFALYWRVYCEHVRATKNYFDVDEIFEKILPEIKKFCILLKGHETDEFIEIQLLRIASLMDFQDEVGRRLLSQLLRDMLPKTSSDLIRKQMMDVLSKVYNNQNEYIRVILELVSDIYDPLEDETDQPEPEVQEERLQTCLSMVLELLEKTSKDLSHSGIRDVFQNLITPSLTSISPTVRRDGFKCLGLYCLLDKEKVNQKLPIFLRGLQVEKDEQILLTVVRNIVDILLVFGVSFAVVTNNKGEEENLITNLRDFLKHENQEIRMAAVEGFCKLFFTATIHDVDILTDLVDEFLNPLTERFVKIRKCLQEFFTRFVQFSPLNRDLVEQAGMRLISRLLRKDQGTMKVLKFLSSLTDYSFLEKFVARNKNVDLVEEKSRQNRLALFLLQELVKNPSGAVNDIPPTLNQLTLNLEDKARFPRLLALAKKGVKYVNDKLMQKQLEKFYNHLQTSPLAAEIEKENEERDDASVVEYSEREEPSSKREVRRGIKRSLNEVLEEHKENFDLVDAFELSVDTPNTKSRKRKRVSFAGDGQMMQDMEERESKRQKMEEALATLAEKLKNQTDTEMLSMIDNLKRGINELIETPEKRPVSTTKYATTSKLKTSSSRTNNTKGRTVASKELQFKSPDKSDPVFKTPEKPARPRANTTDSAKKTPSKVVDLDKTDDSVSINNSMDERTPQKLEIDEADFEDDIAIESAQRAPSKPVESTPPPQHDSKKVEAKKSSAKEDKTPKKPEKTKNEDEEPAKDKTPAKQTKQTKAEESEKAKTPKSAEKTKPEESNRRGSLRSSQERKKDTAEEKTPKKKADTSKDKKEKAEETKALAKDKKAKSPVRQTSSGQADSVILILDLDETKKPVKDTRPGPAQKKALTTDDDDATQIVDSGKNDKKPKRGSAKSTKSPSTEDEDKKTRGKRKRESTEDSEEEKTPPKKARKADDEDKEEGMQKSGSFSIVRSGKKHQSILFTRNAERVGTVVIEDSQASQTPSDSQRRSNRINKDITISFSGFKQSDDAYSLKAKKEYHIMAQKLGANVLSSDKFDKATTHIVAPPGSRTMKTLVGCLMNSWIVRPEWISDSAKAGKFLSEKKYGVRKETSPFAGRNIFISPVFKRNTQYNEQNIHTLIILGQAKLLNSAFGADLILVGSTEEKGEYGNTECWTWSDFHESIQSINQ